MALTRGALGASPMEFPNTVGNAPASRASIWLGLTDKVVSLAEGETVSGLDALLFALRLVRGDSEYAFACAVEEDSIVVALVGRKEE